MRVKLQKNQLDFLEQHLKRERPDLYKYRKNSLIASIFEMNDDDNDIELSDWFGEKQQLIGFDENYELTKESKILDELSDKFYN